MKNRNFISLVLTGALALGMAGCLHNDDEDAAGITSVYPKPEDAEEFGVANHAAADATPVTCDTSRCTDAATDAAGLHQYDAQNTDFTVEGVKAVPVFGADLRVNLYWDDDGTDDVSFLDLGDGDNEKLRFYGGDYYYVKQVIENDETNEVFIYSLSGDIDEDSTDDDTDWLYAGMWLHTPDGNNKKVEVIAFADAYGAPIDVAELEDRTGSATYGDDDDTTPEAGGYYFNDDDVATSFFADAVFEVDFDDASTPGVVTGVVSNPPGKYHGPVFTLTLDVATITSGDGGLFAGDTQGASDGDPIDDDWEGEWAGKFFGGDGSVHPDFVYGTFGAARSGTDIRESLLGFFLARQD